MLRNSLDFLKKDFSRLKKKEMPKNIYYIFHFAAIIGVQNVLKDPYKVLEHNTLLTMNSLNIAKKQKHLKK